MRNSKGLKKRLASGASLAKGTSNRRLVQITVAGAAFTILGGSLNSAQAFNIYDGTTVGNNVEINLDTTLSYTGIVRTNNPSAVLTGPANANGSEGDIDFAHGLVSDLFEVAPVLDIKDGNYGAHFSGEAYINPNYLRTNQNNQTDTLNPISVAKNTDFTSATRNVEGLNARLADAFIYGSHDFGANQSQSATLKIGRQTLLWGQSLFLPANGLSGGMAPFDIITSDNNPNAQTYQQIEPVGQVVVTYSPNPSLTLQGYYQFEWEHDYFEGVGAFFSTTDILDKGGQQLLLPASIGGNVLRSKDLSPESQNGQFGFGAQYTLHNYDLGLFAIRYDEKAPQVYLKQAQSYYLVYPRDIWIEAASISTTIGAVNVAGETSLRQHMDLTSGLGISTALNPGNANSDPLYAVGDTWAAQTSAIYVSPGIPLDPGGVSLDGEIGFNHVLKITANPAAVNAGSTSTAAAMQGVVTFNYYDVLPDLTLGFPIGLHWNFYGRSQMDPGENHGTGFVNFGVSATYEVTWIANLTFNDYLGAPSTSWNASADRNYVLLNLQHSF